MLNYNAENSFERDLKAALKRGNRLGRLVKVIVDLMNQVPLEVRYQDHSLSGEYKGYRECHIEPNWLLIYTVIGEDLFLVRTGTHSDLFR